MKLNVTTNGLLCSILILLNINIIKINNLNVISLLSDRGFSKIIIFNKITTNKATIKLKLRFFNKKISSFFNHKIKMT